MVQAGTHWSGGRGGDPGGLTLLLDNCSLKGFGTGKFFWPIFLVAAGWLLLILGAFWMDAGMVVVDSWWSKDVQCTANSKQ